MWDKLWVVSATYHHHDGNNNDDKYWDATQSEANDAAHLSIADGFVVDALEEEHVETLRISAHLSQNDF